MAKSKCIASMAEQEKEWRAESDLRTLCEAREIRKDTKRMQAAQAMAKKKLEGMASVMSAVEDDD